MVNSASSAAALRERLVLLAEDVDVARVGVPAPEGREVRAPREVRGEVDGAVALAALPDDPRVGFRVLVRVGLVDDVHVVRPERRDVHGAEFADLLDVLLVDEHPVHAGLQSGGDASLPGLPVADRVVGLQPDGPCHWRKETARGLQRTGGDRSCETRRERPTGARLAGTQLP